MISEEILKETKPILKKAKPILFNTEMVKAIQNGTKTATRRAIKFDTAYPNAVRPVENPIGLMTASKIIRPPYQVGDILYVRETWATLVGAYIYRANQKPGMKNPGKWHPSIHMPKKAARIFLRVTDVRVERLQDMTLDDFLAEGIVLRPEAFNDPDNAYLQAKSEYSRIWNSTIKKSDLDKYGWGANPWVTVNEFRRISN